MLITRMPRPTQSTTWMRQIPRELKESRSPRAPALLVRGVQPVEAPTTLTTGHYIDAISREERKVLLKGSVVRLDERAKHTYKLFMRNTL